MEKQYKYILEFLTENSVIIVKNTEIVINEVAYSLNKEYKKYVNSSADRNRLLEEIPENYCNAIFAIWGDQPTAEENIESND